MAAILRPTLVVGVGGTGSEIAERVYQVAARIKDAPNGPSLIDRKLIAILGLDTDDYDHQRRRMRESQKVRFSTARRISDLVQRSPEIEGKWFYRHSELPAELLNMSLLDGAGQVRLFTRLALHDAFKYGGLEANFRQALMGLTGLSNQQAFQGQLNILIVGSLAGGTGCGSFLQTALALRETARRVSITKMHIRGLFLMPDVYAHGAGIAGDQVSNVTVNGYAAMRELNAVMQATSGRIGLDRVDLEYMPGERIKHGQMPYDVVTLIDYETTHGQNLGKELAHYKDLLFRAAYTQLFLPLGQEVDQRSVNSVQQTLAGVEMGTTNSYASSGIFSIVYPEEAILDNLTNRFAREVLDGDWLVLDRAFRRRVEVYEERRRAGDLSIKYPDRGASFISDLEQMAKDRRPLMVDILQNVNREQRYDDGRVEVKVSWKTFMEAFEGHIIDNFRNASEDIKAAYESRKITATTLKNRKDLPDTVNRRERQLDDALRALEDAVRQVPDALYENYWAQGLSLTKDEWQDHHLQKMIVAPAPHLVEVRYLFYLLQREIARRIAELRPEDHFKSMIASSQSFEQGRSKVPEGQRAGAGARNQAGELSEQNPIVGFIFRRGLNTFASKYSRHYNSTLDAMQQYAEQSTLKRSYERLLADINQLQRLLEILFGDLEGLQGEINGWLAEDQNRHEMIRGAELGTRYVFADGRAKDALWNTIKPNAQGQKIGREANSQLVSALFNEARERRKAQQRGEVRTGADDDKFSVRDLFKEVVIEQFCRKTLRDELGSSFSFNVAEAIKREAARAGRNYEEFLTELVRTVASSARPFIQLINEDAGTEVVYWAMHPDTRRDIGPPSLFLELFKFRDSVSAVTGEEYDEREILCVDIRYNFPLISVLKLQPGDANSRSTYDRPSGRYDARYREWIEKVTQSDARDHGGVRSKLTPHLDQSWHKPGFLPEIFPEKEEEKVDALYQDFVLALGMGYLKRDTEAGTPVFTFTDPGKLAIGGATARVAFGHEIGQLLAEIKKRPDITSAARTAFKAEVARVRAAPPVADYRAIPLFVQLVSPELMAQLAEVARNRLLPNVDQETSRVLRGHFDVIGMTVRELRSEYDPAQVRQLSAHLCREVAQQALGLLQKSSMIPDTYGKVEGMIGNVLKSMEMAA